MYLDHFKFNQMPFGLTPNTGFFCNLKGHEEAIQVLLFSLHSGEGFIKIVGEVGAGKTLICRKLLDHLQENFTTAYIPTPDLNPMELRRAFARELGIDLTGITDQHDLLTRIYHRLVELHMQNKRVVLLIDEAQALSLESLEAIRLLTNFETEKTKLFQVVLFGQPELDILLANPQLRQLEQRITFSYYLPLLNREDLDTYLFHRLAVAGVSSGTLFAKKSRDLLYKASRGVPRLINVICHKALLIAYGRGEYKVTRKTMRSAILDTELILRSNKKTLVIFALILSTLIGFVLYYYRIKGII